ncbi:MAG TPA: 1,4-dihydroxy-2-naphthoate polyprenyltransferase [Prolixibacteraceae bacterium]|nr:1,4-dihydroxy-2-naphthoate polyprenyltransferase [Prolixibacteraceae bacterium]
MNIKIWLQAFRLRTLPLALSNAVMGSFLALADGRFRWPVLVLTLCTITFLQILSNLANDYGDAVSGKDTQERTGPQRVTVSGLVTRKEMKRMIGIFISLSLLSGTLLIFFGLKGLSWKEPVVFFVLGLGAIAAALKYTLGKKPYGYKGLGDLFVFLFFGLLGVIGTYYLHTNWFEIHVIIPAVIIGLFSTGVLNINNLRDTETDRKTGKLTLAVQFGDDFARKYHILLLAGGWFFCLAYLGIHYQSPWQGLCLLSLPLFIRNGKIVLHEHAPERLNRELKNLALATFLFALLFGLGMSL